MLYKLAVIVLLGTYLRLVDGHQKLEITDETSIDEVREYDERLTVPGTKWCGPGNTSSSYDDLGEFMETDKCCRSHDHCDGIESGQEKYGLRNNDAFTILHCDCDKKFFECLHESTDEIAALIGRNYFLLRSRCYREAHPIKGCKEYDRLLVFRRCIEYDLDTTRPKIYQWFNLPFYGIEKYPDYPYNENGINYKLDSIQINDFSSYYE